MLITNTKTNVLPKEILSQWRQQGYVLLKNAIDRKQALDFLSAADKVIRNYEDAARNGDMSFQKNTGNNPNRGAYTIIRAIEETSGFDELIDHPGTFPTIMGLMGPYIQLIGTQIYVRPAGTDNFNWHTDAGESLRNIRVTANSLPLNLKIQFFLTDIKEEDRANFCVVPNSHRKKFPDSGIPRGSNPPGAVQLCVEAGDAAIFPYSLWHSVSPNLGDTVRRSVTFRYGQMWCRPYDYGFAPPALLDRLSPRRRRLLGDLGPNSQPTDYYKPQDQLEVLGVSQ